MAKVYQLPDSIPDVTLSGVIGGTLAFAAPEMLTDFRLAGPLADQYGAAATLYTLLSGSPPHDPDTALHLLEAIRTRDASRTPPRGSVVPRGPSVMAKILPSLALGLQYHRSGNLAEAERIYRRILQDEQGHCWRKKGVGMPRQSIPS